MTRPSARTLPRAVMTCVLAAVACFAGSAHAIIINEFGYTVRAGWDGYTPAASAAAPFAVVGDQNGSLGLPTRLRWGRTNATSLNPALINPDLQSQLVLTEPVTGPGPGPQLLTGGPEIPGVRITHRNRIIYSFDQALQGTNLLSNITLTPIDPPGGAFTPPTITFNIRFEETTNADPNCPVDSPDNLCGDIFVLLNPEDLVATIPGAVFGAQFADFNYETRLRLQGLGLLTDAQCEAADAGEGCTGLTTQERQNNVFQAFFSIDAIPVPEPSSLALAGLTVLGVGAARLRRSR